MKVATFNVNSIRSRLDTVVGWLATHKPDVLAVQETKTTNDTFPHLALAATGYEVVFHGETGYNGVALLSRRKPTDVRFGFDDGEQADRDRLLVARIGPVHVVNTYIPQGRSIDNPMYRYKIQWLQRLRAHFERHFTPRQKVLWMGDLNVAPDPIDIYNSDQQKNHVAFHEDVRHAFAQTLDWGFVDVFRKHRPEAGQYTFFDYRQKDSVTANKGWRVDHILATPALARTSRNAWVDMAPRRAPGSSDHTVVVAEFDI